MAPVTVTSRPDPSGAEGSAAASCRDIVESFPRQHALDVDAEKGLPAPAVADRQEYPFAVGVDAEVEMIRAHDHRPPVVEVKLVSLG